MIDRNQSKTFRPRRNDYGDSLPRFITAFIGGTSTIKGYRLVCKWGKNECEYTFIIRSDADSGVKLSNPEILPEDLNVPDSVLLAAIETIQSDYDGLHWKSYGIFLA